MNNRWIIVIAFLLCNPFSAYSAENLRINEFMASNIHSQLNPDASDFDDWIELVNTSDTPFDLSGIFLTDDLSFPFKWPLPDNIIIEPNSFFIVWADGLNYDNHASFKLAKEGGQIGLFLSDGIVIDTITYGHQQKDISYGRFPDGDGNWQFFFRPTFANSNTDAGINSNSQVNQPVFSPKGGLYSIGQTVTISCGAGTIIRYTMDGSLPTPESIIYISPISIDTSSVLRVRAFHDNLLPSEIVTHTYVINEFSTLPVISITTPPEFLFDEEIGITTGITVADTLRAPPPFDPHANFWRDWERPVHIEYFEPNGLLGFKQDAGIKIFGGFFGRQIRQKAFTVFARNKYGDSDIDYPLFPTKSINSFKRFLLRCSSNDFNSTYIRDAMMNSLVIGQMHIDYQAYRPAIVYINGAFWGLYNIREKMNQYYPESNFDINADDVDLIEGFNTTAHGDGTHYQNLIEYVQSHDLSLNEYYGYVQTQMDIGEFINYFISELYVCNRDWLHQNIKCWREHSDEGRWRWLLYDMDWGFGGEHPDIDEPFKINTIQWALEQGESSILFQRLLLNNDFKEEFAQCFATHLNLTFNPERVHNIIETMVQQIEPEMPRQIERWGAIQSMEYWHGQLERLYKFALERQQFVFEHLDMTLMPEDKAELIMEVSDSAAGWITINDVPGPAPFFSGKWYKNIPLRVEAHARPGYRFQRWIGSVNSQNDRLLLTLNENSIMHAVFEPYEESSIIISEIHYNPSSELQGDDDNFEFLELINKGSEGVDISGYCFTDGINFTFPPGTNIDAGECIIAAKSVNTYSDKGFQVFQITDGKLNNSGELLCLSDNNGEIIDQVFYDDHTPWDEAPDGKGPSLELIDPLMDNMLASSWRASKQTGGTPGKTNFVTLEVTSQIIPEFTVSSAWPNPFYQKTSINYSLPVECRFTIKIYNCFGQEVDLLVDEVQKPGLYEISWEPGNLQFGLYFIHMSSGNCTEVYKILYHK